MGVKKEAKLRGRFKEDIDEAVQHYLASIPYDWRLYKYDIEGSLTHAEMLARQKIITKSDYTKIRDGLHSISREIESGRFQFKLELEDIHMNIESRLFDLIGDTAGKLHTARSRNDQVALDMRLFAREAARDAIRALQRFNSLLVNIAEKNLKVIMPGYTHLQQAQPVLFSHHVMAYFQMFSRDIQRFEGCLSRINIMPLGSGALAGLPYPVDREFVAGRLGFDDVSANSIDAVSDRDFIIEFESAASIAMMHLSRMAEEIIIWCTTEFGFIEVGDAYATSSSIMPQKKNPDAAELARGKTGRVYGHLIAMLTVMKGLPLAYNRDLQEDKEGL
ncbi:MAG: argininosuccinate lyase, partial [Dehalococcoidia bacterium]